jgi:RNA recognition motif-containing protein
VGNLAWSVADADLIEYFSAAGQVLSAVVQTHADTGRSKGWALVKLATSAEAQFAIQLANAQEFHDRYIGANS